MSSIDVHLPRVWCIIAGYLFKEVVVLLLIYVFTIAVLEAKKRAQPDISDIAQALRKVDYRAVNFTFVLYIFDVVRIYTGDLAKLLHNGLDGLFTNFLKEVLITGNFGCWERRQAIQWSAIERVANLQVVIQESQGFTSTRTTKP